MEVYTAEECCWVLFTKLPGNEYYTSRLHPPIYHHLDQCPFIFKVLKIDHGEMCLVVYVSKKQLVHYLGREDTTIWIIPSLSYSWCYSGMVKYGTPGKKSVKFSENNHQPTFYATRPLHERRECLGNSL